VHNFGNAYQIISVPVSKDNEKKPESSLRVKEEKLACKRLLFALLRGRLKKKSRRKCSLLIYDWIETPQNGIF